LLDASHDGRPSGKRRPVGREERDPQRFWLMVPGALRQTSAGSALIQAVMAAPDLHGRTIVERLLKHLAPCRKALASER